MNEILLNVISVLVTAVVIPLISLLGTKLYQLINNKINDEKAARCLTEATTIVLNAVRSVFQTYVEQLKNEGGFTKEKQLKALELAKNKVLEQLSTEVKEYLTKNYGDLQNWITNQIEASINLLKN